MPHFFQLGLNSCFGFNYLAVNVATAALSVGTAAVSVCYLWGVCLGMRDQR